MWYNAYIGIPFIDKGRSDLGSDCWGLVRLIYQNELNISLPSYSDSYNHTKELDVLSQIVESEKDNNWMPVNSPEPFDVIILRIMGLPVHVGVVTHGKNMIHCMRGVGTTHEPFNNLRWKDKVLGYARYAK